MPGYRSGRHEERQHIATAAGDGHPAPWSEGTAGSPAARSRRALLPAHPAPHSALPRPLQGPRRRRARVRTAEARLRPRPAPGARLASLQRRSRRGADRDGAQRDECRKHGKQAWKFHVDLPLVGMCSGPPFLVALGGPWSDRATAIGPAPPFDCENHRCQATPGMPASERTSRPPERSAICSPTLPPWFKDGDRRT